MQLKTRQASSAYIVKLGDGSSGYLVKLDNGSPGYFVELSDGSPAASPPALEFSFFLTTGAVCDFDSTRKIHAINNQSGTGRQRLKLPCPLNSRRPPGQIKTVHRKNIMSAVLLAVHHINEKIRGFRGGATISAILTRKSVCKS